MARAKYLSCHFNYLEAEGYQNFYLLLLFDQDDKLRLQFINSSSKNISQFWLHRDESRTGLGGVPGEILPGDWSIILYLPPSSRDFSFRLQFKTGSKSLNLTPGEDYPALKNNVWAGSYAERKSGSTDKLINNYNWQYELQEKSGWFAGDLHCHSLLSDGLMLPRELQVEAYSQGLDFYFITDHNIIPTGWPESAGESLVLPGLEITTTRGHFNLLGAERLYFTDELLASSFAGSSADFYLPDSASINGIMRQAASEEVLVVICHPFLPGWEWDYQEINFTAITALEVLNDPRLPGSKIAADRSIDLLDSLWNKGCQLWGYGGSDIHMRPGESYAPEVLPSRIGRPRTLVYLEKFSPAEIITALRTGQTMVTAGPEIFWQGRAEESKIFPGSDLTEYCQSEKNVIIKLTAEECLEYPETRLRWLENGICLQERIISGSTVLEVELDWTGKDYNWGRMEVRDSENRLLAFSNPVYCCPAEYMQSAPAEFTWQQAVSLQK